MNSPGPALPAGVAAVFCALAALFQLYLGLQSGGVPPETVLFGVLAVVFLVTWYVRRKK